MSLSLSRFRSRREPKHKRGFSRFSGALYGELLGSKKASKDEEEEIGKIYSRILNMGIDLDNPQEQIQDVLRGKYASGDAEKALDLLLLFEDAADGIVKEITPIKPVGAENNGKVTCYLDSLLFALFARLDAFEAMLYNIFEDDPRRRLSTMLRLYVNLLRSGKLVTSDIMQLLQNSLANCGWKEAALQQQQDASEAFTFITETLDLPLLTLKMVVAHGGKEVPDDDHRFISERLLNVAIPSRTNGTSVSLEACLDEYFSNRIEVRRRVEHKPIIDSENSIDSMSKVDTTHIESKELGSDPSTPISPSLPTPVTMKPSSLLQTPSEATEEKPQPTRKRSATVVSSKEHLVQAWCFYSILPFYTETTSSSNSSLAQHFASKRPVLGLCLKRYSWSISGLPIRNGTKVDIPLEIPLPQFVTHDELDSDAPVYGNFKLVLKSAVCHRGTSTQSGHYIALVREDEPSSSGDTTGKPEYGRWMRFDDLARDRVVYVDYKKAFTEETPYLLFYQVEPIESSEARLILNNGAGETNGETSKIRTLRDHVDNLIPPPPYIDVSADSPDPNSNPITLPSSPSFLKVTNELTDGGSSSGGGLTQSLRQTSRSLFRNPSKNSSKSKSRSRSPPRDHCGHRKESPKRPGTLPSLHLLTGRRSMDGHATEKQEKVDKDKEKEKGRKRLSRNLEELFQSYTGSGSKQEGGDASTVSQSAVNTPIPSSALNSPLYTNSGTDVQSSTFNAIIEVDDPNLPVAAVAENETGDGGTILVGDSEATGKSAQANLTNASNSTRTSTARNSFARDRSSRPGSKGGLNISRDKEKGKEVTSSSRPQSKEGKERDKESKDRDCVIS